MDEYVECDDCGFVLLAESTTRAKPRRVKACPGCDGTEFSFSGE